MKTSTGVLSSSRPTLSSSSGKHSKPMAMFIGAGEIGDTLGGIGALVSDGIGPSGLSAGVLAVGGNVDCDICKELKREINSIQNAVSQPQNHQRQNQSL
eukprot:CCRYP_005959-RA/>CCRYP_005959-RA protein AED:0.33 eAED:0.33 QI:278/0/0.5/1/0/0/2/521/98